MTHLSLFSGIGGLDLAAEWAGFETVGQCEWADYPTKVLEKHWPDVPRWRDIRTLTGEDFFAKTGLRTVDVVSGGFPCQPFSTAGKRRGKEDDSYLWPEMLRVIRDLKPLAVVGENVAGIVSLALDQVLANLEGEGYACQAFIVPAAGVGAWHRRARVAILAYSDSIRQQPEYSKARKKNRDETRINSTLPSGAKEPVSNAEGIRFRKSRKRDAAKQPTLRELSELSACCMRGEGWAGDEPGVGRVADGVPHRVDRIRCLGNAVVPQQFYPFFAALAEHMKEEQK